METSELHSSDGFSPERSRTADTDTSASAANERRETLAQLHLNCARGVLGYVWRRTGNLHVAEDITSEVFVRAFERLGDLRPGAAARAWLLRVATNLTNRWVRRRQLIAWVSFGDGSSASPLELVDSNQTDDAGDVELLRLALLALPARFQTVLALHYVESMDVAEIARVLDLPLGTVHSRLSRGRERLRRELQRRNKS